MGMLLMAGLEFIFFTVPSMGQCFGFVLEAVLVMQGSFPSGWAELAQSQGLFCFPPQRRGLGGVHKKLGEDTSVRWW